MARTLTVMLWAELRSVVGGGLSSACLLVAVIMVVRFMQACPKLGASVLASLTSYCVEAKLFYEAKFFVILLTYLR